MNDAMNRDGSTGVGGEQHWQRVQEIFHEASELPPSDREAFLQTACAGDEAVQREVLSLLAADVDDDFLEPPPRARRAFTPGDLVAARYRVVKLLGAGGMGEVYEAEDSELQESVALKIIRPEIASNSRILARFKREIQLARRVTHPNVCRIYDVSHHLSRSDAGDAETKISFVSMELLHGRTLSARLRDEGRMAPGEALGIVRQLAAGLDAAHAASIVHRDFKSANVVLVPAGASGSRGGTARAVITDFGLAQETGLPEGGDGSRLTDTGVMIGTPNYMAPEQLEDGPISPATDVYALGVVLFEMVTGRLPFDGTTPLTIALSRLQQAAPSPRQYVPELDARWEAVILRCLERDPAQRFQSAGEVAAALDAAAPMPRRAARVESNRVLRIALVIAAGLTALGLPFAMSRRTAPQNVATPVTASAPAPANVTLRRAVAVLGFRDLAATQQKSWLAPAFAELLTSELSAVDSLRIVPPFDVERLRSDLSLREGDAIARAMLPRVQERLGADVMISGSYLLLGGNEASSVRLDVRMQDASSGDLLGTISETGTESALFQLVARVGERLRAQLGAAPLSREATAGLRASIPANPEAARAYVEGLTRMRRFDTLAARALFERAIAIEPEFPMAHAALADALSGLGLEEPARAAGDRALALSSTLGREERLSIEARTNVLHRRFDKAIEIYQSLLTFYPDELSYGLTLGRTQNSAGKAKDALATMDKLSALPKPLSDNPAIDIVRADAYHVMHDAQKTLEAARRAETIAAAENMRYIVARAKTNQSYALRELGQPDQAIALMQEAIRMFEEVGDRAAAAGAMSNLGLAYWNRGDLQSAEPILERSLVIHRQIGSRSFESRTLNNLGLIRFGKGDLNGAAAAWRQALVVQRESNFITAMPSTLSNLGGVTQLQGDLDGAEKLYAEAIEVSRRTDDRAGQLTGTVNIAELLRLRGDLAASRAPYERGLALARELEMPQNESYTMAAMAELALWQGDVAGARRQHEAALAIRKKTKDDLSASQSQVMLANLALEEGKTAEANTRLDEAIAVFVRESAAEDEAMAQEARARALLAAGDVKKAETAVARARSLTKESRTLGLLSAIAATEARVLAASGRLDAAAARAAEALEIAKKSHLFYTTLDARLLAAGINTSRGRKDAAATELRAIRDTATAHGLLLMARKADTALRGS